MRLRRKALSLALSYPKNHGKPIITFSAPVLGDHNDFKGAVLGIVTLEMLNNLMKQLSFGETGEVYVLDSDREYCNSLK